MPIYEYSCQKCDGVFEELVFPSSPSPICPHCGSGKTEKLLSRPAPANSSRGGGGGSSCGGCSGGNCASCH